MKGIIQLDNFTDVQKLRIIGFNCYGKFINKRAVIEVR